MCHEIVIIGCFSKNRISIYILKNCSIIGGKEDLCENFGVIYLGILGI
jgi:hypothetical protein